MERLTIRNSVGVAVYKHPFYCEECGEPFYRLPDYGSGSPTDKLAEYEDLEEQGRLLQLPCSIGDTLYTIYTCEDVEKALDGSLYGDDGGPGSATGYYCPYELNRKCPHKGADDCRKVRKKLAVFEDTVDYIGLGEIDFIIGLKYTNECMSPQEIGRTVFYTREEAENKLKEMETT